MFLIYIFEILCYNLHKFFLHTKNLIRFLTFIFLLKGGHSMGISATVEERMKSEAEFGLFFADLKIGKNKANELRQNGCDVLDSKEAKNFPRFHHISWKNAKVKCEDVNLLDENSNEYTLAQKLWIISMKN